MASNLRVDNIQPSTGTGIGIGTANGSVTFNADVTGGLNVTGGKVGIGTDNPKTGVPALVGLHVYTGASGQTGTNSANLIVEDSNDAEIALLCPSTNVGRIKFGDENSGSRSQIRYDHTDDSMQFTVNGGNNEKLRITSGGNVNITNGNLVFSTSGTGIDFSAASGSAAGSTSALLDDYEEGTWTPVASRYTTGAINATYTLQEGFYIKIGNSVTLWCRLDIDTVTSQGTNVTYVGGIPFPAKRSYTGIGLVYFNNAIVTSAVNKVAATTDSRLYMLVDQNGSSNGVYDWQAGDFYFCVTYEVS